MLLKLLTLSILLGFSGFVVADSSPENGLLRSNGRDSVSLNEALSTVQAGEIVIIGEEHGSALCQGEQMAILQTLRARGLRVNVGMEFLEYPQQAVTDQFRAGSLPETDFLKAVGWGSLPFELYREQILFPRVDHGEMTRALNAPRALTGHVAKSGLDSLSDAEKSWLPPGLTRGNDRYFERFKKTIGHLPNPDAADRYFWAQSIWDETMAWQAIDQQVQHPDAVLVIIVGEFHVQYGGGLPARIRARGGPRVLTFSEVNLADMNDSDRASALQPDPIDGARADFIWAFSQSGQGLVESMGF